ncbi:hypothetical protein [Natrinema halophilum]|nr:hypothetical protein [Natrinema halophilum]UHQ96419.1 hypothetical protein HYG82_23550 [Natrinema halophilum]
MSDDAEFREEIRTVIRRHDPDADDLRDLASDLESLADRYEATSEAI